MHICPRSQCGNRQQLHGGAGAHGGSHGDIGLGLTNRGATRHPSSGALGKTLPGRLLHRTRHGRARRQHITCLHRTRFWNHSQRARHALSLFRSTSVCKRASAGASNGSIMHSSAGPSTSCDTATSDTIACIAQGHAFEHWQALRVQTGPCEGQAVSYTKFGLSFCWRIGVTEVNKSG